MGCMLLLKQVRVLVLDKEIIYVASNGEAGSALGIVPRNVYACKFGKNPISSDGVMFLQGC